MEDTEQVAAGTQQVEETAEHDPAAIPESRRRLVKKWVWKVQQAKKHHEDAFKRMRYCQQLAAEGAEEKWVQGENYVAPIIVRHINLAVAQLYAKDPRAQAKPRKRLMYQVWDGDVATLQGALQAVMPQPDPMTGLPMPMMAPPDPNAVAVLQEVQQVKQYEQMRERIGKTMEILWTYFTGEQDNGFKDEMKALVRRTKINGVGYADLMYQRQLEPDPDVSARIADVTQQIARVEQLLHEASEDELPEDCPDIEELRQLQTQLQAREYLVVREGPVFGFPGSTEIIIDPNCTNLRTLKGADWVAREFHLTPEQVEQIYKVDIKGYFRRYAEKHTRDDSTKDDGGERKDKACVWRVQCKSTGQEFVICDGYPDYLKEPGEPDVKVERFFTIIPLVFNEVEHEKKLYPPSDVWLARHAQFEINRSREAQREHRIASKPGYVTGKGMLEEDDKQKLANRAAHEIVELNALMQGEDVKSKLQAMPTAPIDPNLYEVNPYFEDLLRSVGSQEANLGSTSDSTATESSIAESSRSASLSDNVDDLDGFLTSLAKSFGQLCLLELAKETVIEIVGPGAAWPDLPMSRQEIAQDLLLEIKAGSSGKPNAAAELAKIERAAPYLMQIQGVKGSVLGRKYAELLDIDPDELISDGLPSITALNAIMSKPPAPAGPAGAGGGPSQPGTGDPATDPASQGSKGSQNAPNPQMNEAGPQPAFPAPMTMG